MDESVGESKLDSLSPTSNLFAKKYSKNIFHATEPNRRKLFTKNTFFRIMFSPLFSTLMSIIGTDLEKDMYFFKRVLILP